MTKNLHLNTFYSIHQMLSYNNRSEADTILEAYDNKYPLTCNQEITKDMLEDDYYKARRYTFQFENTSGEIKSFTVVLKYILKTKDDLTEGMEWSSTRFSKTYFDSSYLLEQIRNRYAFFDRPTSGLFNIIIDNYAPKLMYITNLNQASVRDQLNLPKTIYTISPWFAQYFGAQQVPSEQLCRILGYSLKDLKNLVTKVKRKSYTVTFIGYGGTVVNTIHWLTEIMKITQSVNLFKQIEIFEPDNIEISNLLRFPKNPYIENNAATFNYGSSKLRLLSNDELSLLSRSKPYIRSNKIDGNSIYGSRNAITDYRGEINNNHIFYGAPNLETRASFEGKGHFISATHNGNDAHLWLNPTQDCDLQVESYGLIQLTPFFMNQLRLAIGFLETLSSDDFDPKGPEQLLLEYSFDGEAKLSTNRTYNFQLGNHSGLVTTEEAAGNAW